MISFVIFLYQGVHRCVGDIYSCAASGSYLLQNPADNATIPSMFDIYPQQTGPQVNESLLPQGPWIQLQEGQDCTWYACCQRRDYCSSRNRTTCFITIGCLDIIRSPSTGQLSCDILIYKDSAYSVVIGSGSLQTSGLQAPQLVSAGGPATQAYDVTGTVQVSTNFSDTLTFIPFSLSDPRVRAWESVVDAALEIRLAEVLVHHLSWDVRVSQIIHLL